MRKLFVVCSSVLILMSCSKSGSNPKPTPPKPQPPVAATFKNPLLESAPDPWVIQKDSFYYYMNTVGRSVVIRKTKKMYMLTSALVTTVYNAPQSGSNSQELWAPEMFFLNEKWYIYYTATDGPDINHRMFVLENVNEDPTTKSWVDKGQLITQPADLWSIDGTILQYKDGLYFIWSGRPGASIGDLTQKIYISKMTNPYTLTGPSVVISSPTFSWEKNGFAVNEGPEILKNAGGKVFLIYSASYCGTNDYSLGMMTLKKDGDPLNPAHWVKTPQPVFTKATSAYGPGHNGFFKSKDGKEDWIIYHANSQPDQGCGNMRNVRMQKINWSSDSIPMFGEPVSTGVALPVPGGE